ncbi:MAG: replication initiation protein, partial [Ruminococcus sp.]|nr:replication initiation protein [Ruminococcus sp.]
LGILEINIEDLKKRIGIKPEDCRRSDRFRKKILDLYQKIMAENTDICYTYRKGKCDKRGKLISIIFYISENENFPDPLNLRDFI